MLNKKIEKIKSEYPVGSYVVLIRDEWNPFKTRPLTDEEKEMYPELDAIPDCKLPDDRQEILVSVNYNGKSFVQADRYYDADGDCYLDSGYEIEAEAKAWMPLPIPYKTRQEKNIQRINTEDINEITLLRTEEYEAARDNIPPLYNWWWLRSPGCHRSSVACVDPNGDVSDYGLLVSRGDGGVRPVLRINPKSLNLQIGEKVQYGGNTYTRIAEDMLLCDAVIYKMPFRKAWRAEDAKDYEASDVKAFIVEWHQRELENRPFDIALFEDHYEEGLTKNAILVLLDLLPEDASLVSMTVSATCGVATGFITGIVAEKLYNARSMDEVRKYIALILEGKEKMHPDGVYNFDGLKIYLGRQEDMKRENK